MKRISHFTNTAPDKVPTLFRNASDLPAGCAKPLCTSPKDFHLEPANFTSTSISNFHVLSPAHFNTEELRTNLAWTFF